MRIRRGGPGDADAWGSREWLLRVDCWAGAPKLVGFYEARGSTRDGTFDARGWSGQVLSLRLGRQPGTRSR